MVAPRNASLVVPGTASTGADCHLNSSPAFRRATSSIRKIPSPFDAKHQEGGRWCSEVFATSQTRAATDGGPIKLKGPRFLFGAAHVIAAVRNLRRLEIPVAQDPEYRFQRILHPVAANGVQHFFGVERHGRGLVAARSRQREKQRH